MAFADELYSVQDVGDMRSGDAKYEWFIDNICSVVVGAEEYKRKSASEYVSKWLSVSSEAFAILAYENYYDNTTSIAEKWKENSDLSRKSLGVEGAAEALYTKKGPGGGKRNRGWSKVGIDRYNELFNKVTEDRKEYDGFDSFYQLRKLATSTSAETLKKRKREENQAEREQGWKAAHDDMSSDEGESDDGNSDNE